METLTKIERWTIRLTAIYVAAMCCEDLLSYVITGLLIWIGLTFTVAWIQNFKGGDW